MNEIPLFRKGPRALSFRPHDEGPCAIVRVPDSAVADPATDELYAEDRHGHQCKFTPAGVYLAAKSGMFGMTLAVDNASGGHFRPLAAPAPDAPRPRRGKKQQHSDT